MFTKGTTFTLSTNEAIDLNHLMLTRRGKSDNDLIHQVIAMGVYQLKYRSKQNARNAELKRLGRESLNLVNSGKLDNRTMRELTAKLGLRVVDEDDVIAVDGDEAAE